MRIIGIEKINPILMLCWACNREPAAWRFSIAEGAATVNVCLCGKCATDRPREAAERVLHRMRVI